MLEIVYQKENRVIINNLSFSFQEFQSIGQDEANLLNYDYLAIFFTNTLKCIKDFNCNQDGISDNNLLKVLNKIANKQESFYIQKRNEFDNPEISLEIQLQNKKIQLQNKKNQLISIRKNYLESTGWYYDRQADEPNKTMPTEIKEKRIIARREINEIEVATSLEDLIKFE